MSLKDTSTLTNLTDVSIEFTPLISATESLLRDENGIHIVRRQFATTTVSRRDHFVQEIQGWLASASAIETAEFEITGIEEIAGNPLAVRLEIRYDLVAQRKDGNRDERVGTWNTEWVYQQAPETWRTRRWIAVEEVLTVVRGPGFSDVTIQALGDQESYRNQLQRGSDYWRTVMDGACGIDIYGNNGVAVGDYDNDGFDDFYVCQPAGLPEPLVP